MNTEKYTCPRCDYSSLRKNDVSRHFQRKSIITLPYSRPYGLTTGGDTNIES